MTSLAQAPTCGLIVVALQGAEFLLLIYRPDISPLAVSISFGLLTFVAVFVSINMWFGREPNPPSVQSSKESK